MPINVVQKPHYVTDKVINTAKVVVKKAANAVVDNIVSNSVAAATGYTTAKVAKKDTLTAIGAGVAAAAANSTLAGIDAAVKIGDKLKSVTHKIFGGSN